MRQDCAIHSSARVLPSGPPIVCSCLTACTLWPPAPHAAMTSTGGGCATFSPLSTPPAEKACSAQRVASADTPTSPSPPRKDPGKDPLGAHLRPAFDNAAGQRNERAMFRRENEGMAGDHPPPAPPPIRPQRPFPSPASPFAAATSIHMPL